MQTTTRKITNEIALYEHNLPAGRYVGMLFEYEGGAWAHSLLNHGKALFDSQYDATKDFFDTKAALPDAVHYAIFGAI